MHMKDTHTHTHTHTILHTTSQSGSERGHLGLGGALRDMGGALRESIKAFKVSTHDSVGLIASTKKEQKDQENSGHRANVSNTEAGAHAA